MHKLIERCHELELTNYRDQLADIITAKQGEISRHCKQDKKWYHVFDRLPDVHPSAIDVRSNSIRVGHASDLTIAQRRRLLQSLKDLVPWRKGPFELFGIPIETEWSSYLKWNRLKSHITPLRNRVVLDIGCSSGYYLFKMNAMKPKMVLGIDPYFIFYYQYVLIQYYLQMQNIYYLPIKLEEMPSFEGYFDAVFCMGILYHRKSPLDTLSQIRKSMKMRGELILETLIKIGDESVAFVPRDRYAKMRNVYFIPTLLCLKHWLERCGFENVRCIDTTRTTDAEQRNTEWVQTESLADFLDPKNPLKTVEGYPAPERAIVIANAA